jgi:YbgC/YbaW family acyl-CoA thioester hydrolase
MTSEFTNRMRVEFVDTDLAGIVHFTRFFYYMEVSEHAFLRSLDLAVHEEVDGRVVSWPRARVECSYKAPLRFGDEFDVHILVREMGRSSITYEFRFLKNGSQLVAVGSATTVCVAADGATGQMSAISIPADFRRRLEPAPVEAPTP